MNVDKSILNFNVTVFNFLKFFFQVLSYEVSVLLNGFKKIHSYLADE